MICLDNLMTALDVDLDHDLYRAQSKFLKRLKMIAVKYNVVIILVAHPRKTRDSVTIEDVAGSGDITNRVDVVMSYGRSVASDEDDRIVGSGTLTVSKNRLTGRVTSKDGIELIYSRKSKRITERPDPRCTSTEHEYGWVRSGAAQYTDGGDLPF